MKSLLLMNDVAVERALHRIAHEIAERSESGNEVVILGIQRGGTHLARRLSSLLASIWKHPIPVGDLDVSMHRDDLDQRAAPSIHPTSIPCDVSNRTVILVDDVLYSGRTTRAAMDALHDIGRPKRIQLGVLIDRGHRELPIKADFVGKNLPTSRSERIEVCLREQGQQDAVYLQRLLES